MTALPPEQEAIWARCYHPSGRFIPFPEAAVERSIPARFEETARLYPDWLAVKTRNRALTYQELNEAANRVAHAIVALRGAGEEPIALLMEKGDSLIAAILGVMKAAKFYVPLDPSFPRERTRYMLDDSGAGVILTTGRHHSLATELARDGIEVMNIEALDPGLSAENPGLELSADSLSWLLYTSGSTGQPKGVLQNHRNILHRIMSYTNALHVSAEDRLVLLHSMSVSGGTTYALAALLNGAALLPFRLEEYGLGNLTDWLIEERITIYNSVPTIFRHLAGILNGRTTFPAMRVIRLGGEPVHKTDVDLYIEHFPPHCIFVNELGSTEAEVMRRYFVDPSTRIPGPTVPVGYAIEGKEVLLLDDDGNEVGFGRIGEIAVKSRYLCVGYWRLPRLTEATFLPDPAGGTGHIYRTGDLGRMRSDQCLEHLGRKDFQVKVRGYRVELPEIEMALGRVDGLKHAIVATWEDIPGHASLVGYVVPSRHPAPTVSEIRSGLSHKLPGHMVPAHFVYLDALPLTPNGKVDRRALPAPDPARPELDRPFAAPRTPTEQALVRIWGDVLGVRQVGIHDNFLDLGGDSLLASRVVSRVIDTFQVELLPQLLSTAPTVADMALAIAQHSVAEEKRIPRQEAAGPCPLSFGQQRLWFTNQMDPTSAAYNMPRAVRIRGSLNRVALQRALDTIVARHEVLRTTYTATDGKPMQVVGQPRGVALPVIDLRESPEVERAAELERLILSETQRPFDLSRDLMLRAALFWSGEDEHVLLLVTYHIASDRWSAGVLFRELATAYQALSRGDRPVLPELPIQYTDFTLWQRHRLQGTILKDLLAYWTRQLGDYSSVLELPADRPRPAIQTARGAIESMALSASLTESLRTLGRAEGATLYMTLLAAFQTLLNRYTGQDDIAVGSPIAGRTRVETEELIGFFVNTLVVRTDLSGNPTFRELLARVRRVALEAYAHQDLPFEKLVEELQPRRSATHSPLYQVVFALRNTPRFTPELSGLIATPLEVDRKSAPNDVVLYMTESERGLSAALEYSTDLFDATTMARMLGHFGTLLQGIVADPDTPIGALPLLTDAERRQLLDEWNDRSGAHPVGTCIHHMFEVQAGRTPDAIAVAFEGVHLTYRELNRQANQVAHHLRALGVGPDVLVGTCMEPSPRIVISLLGILKAGGAYLPLDPAYPRERLAFMLEDSRTSILLADRPGLAALPANGARVVCLDTDGERIATESHEDPECRVSAEHLAYVIYTSGSTGRPKGVMVPHRGLGHVVHAQVRAFDVGPGSRVLQFNSLSFDASIFEIVMALCTGATLCLGTRDALLPGPALGRFLRDHAITTMTLPPSALAALPREEFPRLRTITVAGEACSAELVARWAGGRRFFNLYGTTEATIWSTMAECNDAQATPSIGRPIAGAELYILDPSEQLVPIGIPGELYVGGVGVARGYLNRPELTAATFVANPFSDEPGARLCKTGDLARYLPDGNVELLGRIDQQVKIRGFRVEPGEIEAVLEQHPGVRQALVLARTGVSGETHLVAYVVPKEEEPPPAAVLRSFLTQRLPDYMAPSFFVTLEALPLLPNQKVNRAALPAPDEAGPASEDGFVAARTPVEAALVQIWAEVLGRERVGVHDDFFELGGHSLLAAQILSRVRDVFQVELTLRAIFEAPTIASVAAIIGRCQTE